MYISLLIGDQTSESATSLSGASMRYTRLLIHAKPAHYTEICTHVCTSVEKKTGLNRSMGNANHYAYTYRIRKTEPQRTFILSACVVTYTRQSAEKAAASMSHESYARTRKRSYKTIKPNILDRKMHSLICAQLVLQPCTLEGGSECSSKFGTEETSLLEDVTQSVDARLVQSMHEKHLKKGEKC